MKTLKFLLGTLPLTCVLAVSGYAQSFLTNGLVAYYPFNGNANDASGNGIDGTVSAATLAQDRFGNTNSAYLFDGISTYINYGNPPALSFSNAFTLSAWIAPRAGGGVAQMIGCKEHEYWLAIINGTLGCAISVPGTDTPFVWAHNDSHVSIPGGWTQVAVVYSTPTASLFMNGASIASFTIGGPITNSSPGYSTADFRISGRQEVQPGPYGLESFSGTIDDVRLYNRALSPFEIQQLYAFESQPDCSLEEGRQTVVFQSVPRYELPVAGFDGFEHVD